MDIIAEILETDRLAEEKLAEAERKRAAMLENVRSEQERFDNIAREDSASYAAALEAENNSRIDRELEELDARKQKEFSELEAVFEKNSGRWADEIFSRIIAL